jgi:hypothetical protein
LGSMSIVRASFVFVAFVPFRPPLAASACFEIAIVPWARSHLVLGRRPNRSRFQHQQKRTRPSNDPYDNSESL